MDLSNSTNLNLHYYSLLEMLEMHDGFLIVLVRFIG
jgi:hypothetical protein